MGHSSGATIAALLGVLDDIADSTALDPVSQQSSRLQAVISAAGVHDLLKAIESNPLAAPMLQSFTGKAITYQPRATRSLTPTSELRQSATSMLKILHFSSFTAMKTPP